MNDRFSVKRIYSARTLQAVGRVLRNCCAEEDTARRYLKDSDMWVLLDRGKAFWLLAVDADRKLEDCRGHGNGEVKPVALGRQAMCRLLEILDASADAVPEFVVAGFHSALLHAGVEDADPVEIDGREFIVHRFEDGFLLGCRRPGRRWRWSPFLWKQGGSLKKGLWDQPVGGSKLASLIVRCPELGARIRG